MTNEPLVTAQSLRSAFQAGYAARFGGRGRTPPLDCSEHALAWTCGWNAADCKIYEFWRG